MSKVESFIDPSVLFRFEVPLRQFRGDLKSTIVLPVECRLPTLGLSGTSNAYAEVRMAWSTSGLIFHMQANDKRQLPWCREQRAEESDGFHLWVDTRCSPDIHRATRYCHHFVFSPLGGGVRRDRPFGALVPINRARENPQTVLPEVFRLVAKLQPTGYVMSGLIPSEALTGFDPSEHARLGFFWAVIDREMGWQGMALNEDLPVAENPSLWSSAILLKS